MKPPDSPELKTFYEHTLPLSTETLEIERDALHALILEVGPRLHIIREILKERNDEGRQLQ